MFAALVVLVLVPSVFVSLICLWHFYLYKKYNVPGPKPLPLVGNCLDMGTGGDEVLQYFITNGSKYKGYFRIFLGPMMKLVFLKPELMKLIMTSTTNFSKTDTYDMFRPLMGDGLLTSTGDKWKSRRKLMEPTFHFKLLDNFLKTFDSTSDVLLDILTKKSADVIDHAEHLFELYSLNILCETTLGININALTNEHSEYVTALGNYFKILVNRWYSSWLRYDIIFRLSPNYKEFRNAVDTCHKVVDKIIQDKREVYQSNQINCNEDDYGIKQKVALLDMLLKSEESNLLTNEDIREELNTVMMAGHDTTALGIAFTLYELSVHPEIQQRLYDEISTVDELNVKNLLNLKYLDMVLRETLRKYPTAPILERALDQETEIEGVKFPKGTSIMMPVYALHHMEEYWPDPETFDPDRFLPENIAKTHPYAFVPFSSGPRGCIGQKFAQLEMKVTLFKILKKFKIVPVPGYTPIIGTQVILRPLNGLKLKLELRDEE